MPQNEFEQRLRLLEQKHETYVAQVMAAHSMLQVLIERLLDEGSLVPSRLYASIDQQKRALESVRGSGSDDEKRQIDLALRRLRDYLELSDK